MASLLTFPDHMISSILDILDAPHAVNLAQTSKFFHQEINRRLYRKLMIVPNSINKLYGNKYTLVKFGKVDTLVKCLKENPANCNLIEEIIINTQSNSINNPYSGLYEVLENSKSLEILENMDITNLRAFQSVSQICPPMKVLCEGDYELEDDTLVPMVQNNRRLINRTIFDYDELLRIPVDYNSRELMVLVDSVPSLNIPSIKDSVPNLSELYLSSPAATLAFLQGTSSRLTLDKLSLTNTHTVQNFGFKSGIKTKLSFDVLNNRVDISRLKELELKINCDFHNNCEDQCICSFFHAWERNIPYGNLKKFALINYKSNTSSCNIQQFYDVINHFPESIMRNLEELYINVDDYTKLQKPETILTTVSRSFINLDFSGFISKLSQSNLTKLVLPDFFQSWLVHLAITNEAIQNHNSQSCNYYFEKLVNGCDCQECDKNRNIFTSVASLDAKHGFTHKFDNGLLSEVYSSDNELRKIDTTNENNFKFLNYIVCVLKKRLTYSHKNLFTINSVLKMKDRPLEVPSQPLIHDLMIKLFMHSCLEEILHDMVQDTSITDVNLGGLDIKIKNFSNELRPIYFS